MKTVSIPLKLLPVILLLGTAQPSSAGQIQTSMAGNLGASENACTQIVQAFTASGCTYGNDRIGTLGWIGPVFFGGHYAIGSAGDSVGHTPSPGDGKIAPGLAGSLTIDDNNTAGNGSDDVISATLMIGPAARYVYTGQVSRAVERWTSMTHTMAPTAVSAATANALGGFDYVIGLHGFPQLLCSASDPSDCFASENAPLGIPSPPSFWSGFEPNGIGIERNANQGGNVGATTTAVFAGYSCSESSSVAGSDCLTSPIVWGGTEDPGFDNLLLRLVTNGAGQVVSANGYWTQEWRILFGEQQPGDNSWIGGTLVLAPVPVPAAAWLFGSALGAMVLARRQRREPASRP